MIDWPEAKELAVHISKRAHRLWLFLDDMDIKITRKEIADIREKLREIERLIGNDN